MPFGYQIRYRVGNQIPGYGYLFDMRDWTIEVRSEPYGVAEHDRGAFDHANERLKTELSGNADAFGSDVGTPLDGRFSATFSLRAKTAGEAAERGCDIFLSVLEEALRPLRFPESELGPATGIDEPLIASVAARSHEPASMTALNDAGGPSETAAAGEVELNSYRVTSETVKELTVRLRALPGEWKGPAAKVALQLEMSAEGAREPSLDIEGPECDAVCEALQKWIGEIPEGTDADELIVLVQGIARKAAEQ